MHRWVRDSSRNFTLGDCMAGYSMYKGKEWEGDASIFHQGQSSLCIMMCSSTCTPCCTECEAQYIACAS
jgi:hypothetical protein